MVQWESPAIGQGQSGRSPEEAQRRPPPSVGRRWSGRAAWKRRHLFRHLEEIIRGFLVEKRKSEEFPRKGNSLAKSTRDCVCAGEAVVVAGRARAEVRRVLRLYD